MKNQTKSKNTQRLRRHARVRAKVVGTAERPRLAVYRSNRFVSAQLIDDAAGTTLASAHGREFKGSQGMQAKAVGEAISGRAKAKGILTAVFDRGGYRFGGQVKALAEAARGGRARILILMTLMEPEIIKAEEIETVLPPEEAEAVAEAAVPEVAAVAADRNVRGARGGALRGRAPRGGGRGTRAPRERSEFDQVTIDARRVARVMAGGRRFNFSLVVVIGDRKGRVGVGLGKAADTALAIDKATRDAKKHLLNVARTSTGSIPHQVKAKYAASVVEIIPSSGRGLVAGSAMRTVLDLAGVTDVVTKIHTRSKNKLTIARATIAALKKLRTA